MIDPREVALLQREVELCAREVSTAPTRLAHDRAELRLHQAQHALRVAQEQLADQRNLLQLIPLGQLCGICGSDRLVAEPCRRHVKCRDCSGFSAVER